MKKISRDIVSALILSKDGLLLMGKKDPAGGGVYADCWHIPGGGVEEREDQIAALRREIEEEVGLDIGSADISLVDNLGSGISTKKVNGEEVECHMKFFVYKVEINENHDDIKTTLSDDLKIIEWVEIGNLASYKLTPPSTKLFTRLGWMGQTPE